MGPKTMQLLKAMRVQLGEASASRSVDAVAAAEGLGMDTTTHDFDRISIQPRIIPTAWRADTA
jgi:hypothetical protein